MRCERRAKEEKEISRSELRGRIKSCCWKLPMSHPWEPVCCMYNVPTFFTCASERSELEFVPYVYLCLGPMRRADVTVP